MKQDTDISTSGNIRTDFLVIGSGIAGLSFAIKAARYGTVAIITKKEKAESNTNYAQGGIAAVVSSDDSPELHIEDTLNAGVGLCHPEAVNILVHEGPGLLRELMSIGVDFTKKGELLDLGREGGHSRNRIVHAHDRSGAEIERALLHAVSTNPNIQIFENHLAIEIITEHHLGYSLKKGVPIHCWGVYALDRTEAKIKVFLASYSILCSGGLGQVYLHTTNPLIATGDGVAMAYRAGALIGNMEFIQFHPTSLYDSGSPVFLISEAVRGAGGKLLTMDGKEFMHQYDARGDLAPRDIVARAIDSELKKHGDPHVYLDLRHLGKDEIRLKFPHIYETCLLKYKIDITTELIPVVPAAHYACGGVITDLNGRSSIRNLYACGEVAMTGVHGANRLASNSLLEALVFSHRAWKGIMENFPTQKPEIPEIPPWDDSGTFDAEEWVLIEHNKREIQQIMWDYVGIVRSDLRLGRAYRRLQLIGDEIENFYKKTKITEGLIELRNITTVADLIVRSAIRRKESRGLHFTTDYPNRYDEKFKCDTILSWRDI
jgi:L-aspartate oxidase